MSAGIVARPDSRPLYQKDGLYSVTTGHFSAAYVIQDGEVVWCAPILRKRFPHWQRRAERIGDSPRRFP